MIQLKKNPYDFVPNIDKIHDIQRDKQYILISVHYLC